MPDDPLSGAKTASDGPRGGQTAKDAPLGEKSVRELQDLVGRAAASGEATAHFSRAAELHLIDELSRKGATGIGLLAGVVVFAAATFGRALPVRASVWAVMVFAALYAADKLRRNFRTGGHRTARPFRWRADYAASLAVLSASVGAGAILLAPTPAMASATTGAAMQLVPLLAAGLALAAASHAAHLASATALLAPGFVFITASAARAVGFSFFGVLMGISAAAAISAVIISARRRANVARDRFPRTRRRLVEDAIAPADAPAAERGGDFASGAA